MKQRRLFWQIVEKIESSISNGNYPVGSRLPSERLLAETYEVSRPTIREAIIALEVRGKVEVKTSSGVYVLQQTKTAESIDNISPFELTQARALIEGEAAALAALVITNEELILLENSLNAMKESKTPDDTDIADKQFHIIIAKATRNKAIQDSIYRLWDIRQSNEHIKDAYLSVCCGSSNDRMNEHKAIYHALSLKDPIKAREAMHHHFNRLINALFDASEAKALEEIKRKTNATRDLYSLNHIVKTSL